MKLRVIAEDRAARRGEARAFFEETRGAVHCVLTSLYRVVPAQTTELERYLSDWFEMFTTRLAILQIPIASTRLALLIATCRVGCIFALARLTEAPTDDEQFKEFLRIEPQIVAEEVEEKLKLGLAPDAKWDRPRPDRGTES